MKSYGKNTRGEESKNFNDGMVRKNEINGKNLRCSIMAAAIVTMVGMCSGCCSSNMPEYECGYATLFVPSYMWAGQCENETWPVLVYPYQTAKHVLQVPMPEVTAENRSLSANAVFEQTIGKRLVWIPAWSKVNVGIDTYEYTMGMMQKDYPGRIITAGLYLKELVATASEEGSGHRSRAWWFYTALVSEDHVLIMYIPSDSRGRKAMCRGGRDPVELLDEFYAPVTKSSQGSGLGEE